MILCNTLIKKITEHEEESTLKWAVKNNTAAPFSTENPPQPVPPDEKVLNAAE